MNSIPPSSNFLSPTSYSSGSPKIRVLVVDDSPLICDLLENMINDSPDVEVVGRAENGQEGVRMAVRLQPDIITMDIRMPKMDGLEATRKIMSLAPTPIVVISSSVYANDTKSAFNAIEAGALTVVEKPNGLGLRDYQAVQDQLLVTIRTMAGVQVVKRGTGMLNRDGIGPMTAMLHDYFSRPVRVIAIGASTGGPPVLMRLFSSLPADFSIPIVVVQHILPAFLEGMADWLKSRSVLPLQVAQEGARILPGNIYLAPANSHMMLSMGGFIHLDPGAPLNGQRPSVTRLFESIAKTFGANAVGMILTGMGEDGVEGLEAMSRAGAHIIAQNQASSVVYGMPGAAVQHRIVDEVLSPDEIIVRLTKLQRHMQTLGRSF